MKYELTLSRQELQAGARVAAAAAGAITACYVVSGDVRLQSAGINASFAPNSAFSASDGEIVPGAAPAVLVRWQLSRRGSRGEEGTAAQLLKAELDLDPNASYLLRCDRVDFPPGGVALTHTHQGGGIRCLIKGSIEIQTAGTTHTYGPLQGWFEPGPEPVFAAASKTEPSAFVRLMILPRALLGKSSIRYVNEEDLAKPKNQSYQIFIDAPIDLPGA